MVCINTLSYKATVRRFIHNIMNSIMQYKRPESVLVLVYTADRQVLVLRRLKPAHFWQSVAGSLEWGESPFAAAKRELSEETGFDVGGMIDCQLQNRFLIYPMWRERYGFGVIENTEHVFRLQLDEARPATLDPHEHSEFCWLDARDAKMRVSSHTNRAAIEQWVV